MMKEAMFLLVIIILVNPEESMADSRAQTIQFTCTQELDQNTTTFIRNFVASMENISDQIRTLGFGVAISEEGPSANYALAQCYGDLTPVDCVSCYTKARTTLPQCFPFTGGRIFLDGCFMRSENYSFFQEFTGPQDTAMCGNKTKMDPGFEGLATRAVLQAAADAPSNNGSSRAEFPASGSGRKNDSAYVLAECWRLLNSNSCKVCLQNAAKSLLGCLPWSEGRALHTGCFMRYSATNFLNPKPLTGLSIASRFPMAKPGCINTCGNNVMIPYPFGVGADCALNESYTIRCRRKSTNVFRDDLQTPFVRVKGNEYEVLEVSLRDQTVTIIDPLSNSSCNVANASGFGLYDSFNLDGTPFFYSKEHNQLKLLGCGNAYLYQHLVLGRSEALSECKSACSSENTDGCQTDIPFNLNQYTVNFIKAKTSLPRCTSAILADKQWKPQKNSYPPVVWSWTLQNPHEADGVRGCSLKSRSLEIESGNVIISYGCECSAFGSLTWGYEINPYLNGSCDHASSVLNGMPKDTKKVAIISGTTGFGTFLLMVAFFASYKIIKKWHIKKRKEKFFKRNGGLLLQQQLSSDEGVVDKTMIFSATELNKASDGFNPNRVLGEGGQGTVYKGMLTDGRIVAIKKSNQVGERELEQFINEVVILSQVNHRNVVKVLGCCLETEVPLLVYEFIPNGTLYNLIHNKHDQEFPLTWSMRLRIAMEVASALAYLHSSISMPIFHKDIKSSNILLDEKYTAKVADFGTSRSVAIDKTHLTTRVQGTFGYIDPEYFQSGKFTDKSDVYSFGVVLIELLTRQKPTSAGKGEDSDIGLAGRFLKCMEKAAILDPEIMDDTNEEDEIIQVAKLAKRCIRLNGRRRPTMKEVAMELESIKLSFMLHSPTMESSSPRYQIYLQQELGVHTWTYGSEFTVPSASQSIPLLFDTV